MKYDRLSKVVLKECLSLIRTAFLSAPGSDRKFRKDEDIKGDRQTD